MEGINGEMQLFEYVKDIYPAESMLRCFNLLFPFEQALPKNSGSDLVNEKFD